MTDRLARRLRRAMDGQFDPHDTPRKLYQDALTDLLRQNEQLTAMEKFVFFMKGFLKDGGGLPPESASAIGTRLNNLEADFKRMTRRGRRPCS